MCKNLNGLGRHLNSCEVKKANSNVQDETTVADTIHQATVVIYTNLNVTDAYDPATVASGQATDACLPMNQESGPPSILEGPVTNLGITGVAAAPTSAEGIDNNTDTVSYQ